MSRARSPESKTKSQTPKRSDRPVNAPQRAPAPQRPALLQRAIDDPASLSTADVSALQRQIGNSAVTGLLARRDSNLISAPVATPAHPSTSALGRLPGRPLAAPAVQRATDQIEDEEQTTEAEPATAPGTVGALGSSNPDDEETISRKTDPVADRNPLQRVTQPEDADAVADEVQRKPDLGPVVGLAGGQVDDSLEKQIQTERGSGQALPGGVRRKVEGALDADLSAVHIHTGQASDSLNRSLGARAFTTGSDIFFRDGEYDPASSGGQSLLAHELTHVVQQGAAVRRRRDRVQRSSSTVAQREVGAGAYGNQRREWKDMSTLGKMAMVPGGALYGAGQAAAGTYGGIYNQLAGQNAGTGRRVAAGLGSAIAGTVALPFALAGGALRGLFQGIANPIHSVGKRVGGAAAALPGRARGAIGNYGAGLTRDQNLLGSTTGEIANYGVVGTGTAATGARTALDISSRATSGDILGNNTLTQSQISGAGTAFGVLGAGAGILGAGAAVMDTMAGAREATRGGLAGSSRALAVGQTLSSAGEAVKQSSMAAYNIASLVNAQGVAAAGAQIVAGGASVAIGIIDMLRGGYGVLKGRERENLLLEIARDADKQANAPELTGDVTQGVPQSPEMATEQQRWRSIAITARAAARTQATRQTAAGMTIGKGALAIAGGALLLASAATPIGWGLLAGAAIVGGVIAAVRYFRRKKARRQTVIDALPPAIKAERVAWKAKKVEAENTTIWGTTARREALRAIGPDPLEVWLRSNGFTNVDHAYARYINDTAGLLFENAVLNDKPEMVRLVEAMGLRVNKQQQTPTARTIASALDK